MQKGPAVASTTIGQGNTNAWKLCGLDNDTCLTVLFDISSSDKPDHSGNLNPQLYIQTLTRYKLDIVFRKIHLITLMKIAITEY